MCLDQLKQLKSVRMTQVQTDSCFCYVSTDGFLVNVLDILKQNALYSHELKMSLIASYI